MRRERRARSTGIYQCFYLSLEWGSTYQQSGASVSRRVSSGMRGQPSGDSQPPGSGFESSYCVVRVDPGKTRSYSNELRRAQIQLVDERDKCVGGSTGRLRLVLSVTRGDPVRNTRSGSAYVFMPFDIESRRAFAVATRAHHFMNQKERFISRVELKGEGLPHRTPQE